MTTTTTTKTTTLQHTTINNQQTNKQHNKQHNPTTERVVLWCVLCCFHTFHTFPPTLTLTHSPIKRNV